MMVPGCGGRGIRRLERALGRVFLVECLFSYLVVRLVPVEVENVHL